MRASLALIVLACALLAAGCGGSAGEGQTTLVVTRDFGRTIVESATEVEPSAGLTAMRQLQKSHSATTSFGGRYVDSINGMKENGDASWLYYVDGVEADRGATGERLSDGQHVQWDFHAWQAVRTGGAIVGAYPEPMKSRGANVLCAPRDAAACSATRDALVAAGVSLGGEDAVRVFVGEWSSLDNLQGVPNLSRAGATNGAFAQFTADGKRLTPFAEDGAAGDPIGAAGLLAAFAEGQRLTWVVSGTDAKSVTTAARELEDPAALANRFGVLAADGAITALPERPTP